MDSAVTPLLGQIQQAAQVYLKQQTVQPIDFEGYPNYLINGNRLDFEKQYFERRRQLAVLALAYQQQPQAEVKIMLERVIWEICNEFSWALPAHLPITGQTFGTASSQWIDLFAAETSEALAEIQSLLGSRLSPQINQRIDQEINRRIFEPFMARDWSWQHKANNWSAVIAGCLGLTTIFKLTKSDPKLPIILQRLDIAFETYLSSFGDDGACVEGVSYWAYGFGYYLYFAEKAAQVLGERHYLDNPKVKKIAAFPFLTMISATEYLPFSDYALSGLPSGLLCYCHEIFGVEVPEVTKVSDLDFDNCYRFAQLYRNLIWTKQIDQTKPKTTDFTHYFADVQWLNERDQSADFVFATKGGSNLESHNHLDLGHFIFGNQAQLFLTDLGAGEYTKDYFNDAKRYQYFVTSAASHSIPIINQVAQTAQPTAVTGDYQAALNQITYNLTTAYGSAAKLASFKRQFKIDTQSQWVQITDDFEFTETNNQVTECFITQIEPQCANGQVRLTNKFGTCLLNLDDFEVLQIIPVQYIDHYGKSAKAYRIQVDYQCSQQQQIVIELHLLNQKNEEV